MHTVSPEVNSLIVQVLARGTFSDPDEVLLEALHNLLERQDAVGAVQRGLDDAAAGRTRPWREAVDDARARHNLPKAT